MFVSLPPELELQRYGLDADETYNFHGILNNDVANGTIRQAQDFLNHTYCGSVSIEFAYIESEHEREWLVENYEKLVSHVTTTTTSMATSSNVSIDEKKSILELLLKSQTWDTFLAKKFPTVKRYGGEVHLLLFLLLSRAFKFGILYYIYIHRRIQDLLSLLFDV